MPTEHAHLSLAGQTQKLIDHLLERKGEFSAWIVTAAFYKALHLVEALFAHDSIGHGHNHEHRERLLKTEKRYSHIFEHYRPLWAASMVARYLADPRGKHYKKFSDYITPERVETEILRHRLHQVERSVAKLLG